MSLTASITLVVTCTSAEKHERFGVDLKARARAHQRADDGIGDERDEGAELVEDAEEHEHDAKQLPHHSTGHLRGASRNALSGVHFLCGPQVDCYSLRMGQSCGTPGTLLASTHPSVDDETHHVAVGRRSMAGSDQSRQDASEALHRHTSASNICIKFCCGQVGRDATVTNFRSRTKCVDSICSQAPPGFCLHKNTILSVLSVCLSLSTFLLTLWPA